MKWFKHDGNALHDAKIEKLIMKYGIEGYGLYFACVEIIAGALTSENINFELEHDAEILGHKFKIDTLRVEEIMKYMVKLGLFQYNDDTGRIVCYQLLTRLDISTSSNPEFKKMQGKVTDYKKLLESNSRREENTIEEKIIKKNTPKAECFTFKTKVGKYKGNSPVKTWCRLFKPMCDSDDSFCMKYFNLIYNGLVREYKSKGLDPKSGAFYGTFNTKIQQMFSDPDSEIHKKLKEHYNEMPVWLEEEE